ncbi:MAG: M28 family peptidase [Saccharofermentanaceae bacterium]|nr:M28 family peptidase [Clostridia bacterium]NLX68270.1 M28 family peptidase [Clostridiaceae bacterium]HPG64296.1 M28 family peptidase [Saccharofermentans sp.]HPM74697.1 M28 family peptidase [Saccharofermentans sp.]HRV51175.1 M28 family peptidase [Saccharofermentans sp.]
MKNSFIYKLTSIICVFALVLTVFVGCLDGDSKNAVYPAAYGSYGADFARELAESYPFRKAFTEQEREAGEMIKSELEELGLTVEVQSFTNAEGASSQNYIVNIPGQGFLAVDDDGNYNTIKKTIVIGAHYDSFFAQEEIPEGYTYDGIDDNASGVGCLMTIASQISNYNNLGFDVELVFFGAGSIQAGSIYYYNSLTNAETSSVECMFCIDGIYAGDKLYANAGLNSLDLSQKYQMRRKLYQVYDVVYDNPLYSGYEFSLYYNECGIIADLNGDGIEDVYREVSIRVSDHTVFDNAGVPVVYFDSYDYFFDEISKMKETKNLNLQEFGGQVGGTLIDSSTVLDPIFVTTTDGLQITDAEGETLSATSEPTVVDRLQVRINCLAYSILETLEKGSDYGITFEEYDALMQQTSNRVTTTPSDDEDEVEG